MKQIEFRYFSIDENDDTREKRKIEKINIKDHVENENYILKKFPINDELFDPVNMYIEVRVGLSGNILCNYEVHTNKDFSDSYMDSWLPPTSSINTTNS